MVDLTKEGSSTIVTKRIASNPMDIDKERKKEKPYPKPKLQLLTYTRGKSTESTTETRSFGPSFSVEFFNTAILGQKYKGKGPALVSVEQPSEPHSLISQFKQIAEVQEMENQRMIKDLQLPEYPKRKLISILDYHKGQLKFTMLESQVAQAKSLQIIKTHILF